VSRFSLFLLFYSVALHPLETMNVQQYRSKHLRWNSRRWKYKRRITTEETKREKRERNKTGKEKRNKAKKKIKQYHCILYKIRKYNVPTS
jgi:protein subunit release factor B